MKRTVTILSPNGEMTRMNITDGNVYAVPSVKEILDIPLLKKADGSNTKGTKDLKEGNHYIHIRETGGGTFIIIVTEKLYNHD